MKSFCLILLTATLIGCARPDAEPPRAPIPNVAPLRPQTIGYSVQGRPIELHTLVPGPRPVLVMGAIHGDEPTSENVSRGLLNDLRLNPSLAGGTPVVIIPVANPDGLAMKSRTNANKIDVNRNFPSKNFGKVEPGRTFRGGTIPASEPETRALIETTTVRSR
jgi:protein MpaA